MSVHHHEGDYSRLRKKMIIYFFRKRILFAGVSKFIKNDLKKSFSSWSADKFVTIYNSNSSLLDGSNRYSRYKSRQHLNFKKNDFIFANVGRLHKEKNQQIIIRAFSKFLISNKHEENIKIIFIGIGNELENLKNLAQEHNCLKNIIFYGYLKDAKKFFSAFDCFILSTLKEPFGMVLLESIMADNIVLAANSGGPKEIIKNKDFLFNDSDYEDLEYKMTSIYNNFQTYKEINKKVKSFVEQNFMRNNFKFFLDNDKNLKKFLLTK